MEYVVMDLEFNQPFDFKNGQKTVLNPECPFEIIQIGAVKLNDDFEEVGRFNQKIKPCIYKKIHPYVEKITGISNSDLKECRCFTEVFEEFACFAGKDGVALCTWGIDDIKSLFKNMLYYNVALRRITDRYINVQTYATKYCHCENGKTIGLKSAVEYLHIPVEENFHDALNDAYYTAEVFKVVKPTNIQCETFDVMDLTKKKLPRTRINTKALLHHFSDIYHRELTQDEVDIIKAAYKLGRNLAFDISYDKFKKVEKKQEGARTV